MSINRGMEKQISVCPFNGILFSSKKELKIRLNLKSVMLGEEAKPLKKVHRNDL